MNVYDFDETIYQYDSSVKFFIFCLLNTREVWLTLPIQIWHLILFGIGITSTKVFKARFFRFLMMIPDVDNMVKRFWKQERKHISDWYINQKRPSDIVISASPLFIVNPMCKMLGIKTVIATDMDKKTGVITGENCKGEEKVRRLLKLKPDIKIEQFYSDSLSDAPLANMASEAFLVKKEKTQPWPTDN